MEIRNLAWRTLRWRFQNPVTIFMTLVQPIMWLLLFGNLFKNQQENYLSFILAGILVMSILFSSGMSGIANYALKENGSQYRIMISPVKRGSIVIAHFIDAFLSSCIQVNILILISLILGTRIKTGILGFVCLLLLLAITVLFVSTLSYLLSISIPDENSFIAMINTFTLPLFFASTALVEKENMIPIFQRIATFNPFSYVVDSFRNIIMTTNINYQTYAFAFIIMFILAVISCLVCTKKLKQNK